MNIRQMTMEDYPDVYALWTSLPGIGLNEWDDSMEGIARYLNRNPATCFVARDGDALLGVILSGHDGRRGSIHHMAVAEAARGKGIGTALLNAALDALRTEGIRKVFLVVFQDNQVGNSFWERTGFTAREDLVYRNRMIVESTSPGPTDAESAF